MGRTAFLLSYAADIVFASLVVYYSGGPSSDFYLLYALLAMKGSIYYPLWHEIMVVPFVTGPVYVLVLYLSLGSWLFLLERPFQERYLLLLGAVLASLYLGWLNERAHLSETGLRRSLAERTVDLDRKTGAMQQMATNLGNRVLELRTLQEGIKAINSALALENVLRLIVANASQVLEGARCSVALLDEEHNRVVSMAASEGKANGLTGERFRFDQGIAASVVQQGKPLLRGDALQDGDLGGALELSVSSVVGVPLFLGNRAIGALIATSPDRDAFSIEDLNLLNAFADQAAVAVKNARLYEQLAQEQRQTTQLYAHVEERRNELEAILRGIGDGVIVTDPDLNLLLMNPVAARIFHVKSALPSSVPLVQVIPHAELNALFQDALQGQEKAVVREIPLSSSGDKGATIYQALASPVLSADGHARGVVTVLRDVTSQKELERMKSNFLSVVSHELKTPLHSIKGFVDIILMGKTGPINETQTDFLKTVRDQTAHLQNLISDLLEFSRLESGQVKLRLTEVSLAEVATAVVDKLKLVADQGQVQLVNRVPADIASIEADRMRIEQVLTNLVDNAVKFTAAAGNVTIQAADLGTEVQVSVSDTGIGIPSGELERVFDRFYQVDSGSTRHYRGTGLGLTICKHIVEYHRGRIWVESREGKGSTFFFVLPKHITTEDEQLLLDFLSLPKREQG
jgi:signal transduction histidine kinase